MGRERAARTSAPDHDRSRRSGPEPSRPARVARPSPFGLHDALGNRGVERLAQSSRGARRIAGPPADLAAIPVGAGIATFESAVDLAGIAVSLAREELLFAGDEEARKLLNSVTAVFSAAAARLAELQSDRLRDLIA